MFKALPIPRLTIIMIDVSMYMCAYVCMYVRVHVCLYICIYVHMYALAVSMVPSRPAWSGRSHCGMSADRLADIQTRLIAVDIPVMKPAHSRCHRVWYTAAVVGWGMSCPGSDAYGLEHVSSHTWCPEPSYVFVCS